VRRFGARERAALAASLILLALLLALIRLPTTLSGLNAQARKNDAYGANGRQLAAADSLDVDNGVAEAALQYIPSSAAFAVLPPTPAEVKSQSIQPLTLEALFPYFRSFLLPRREVDLQSAQYVVCYACDPAQSHGRVTWLWSGENAMKIGRVRSAS
jgi:hypothetical protein